MPRLRPTDTAIVFEHPADAAGQRYDADQSHVVAPEELVLGQRFGEFDVCDEAERR